MSCHAGGFAVAQSRFAEAAARSIPTVQAGRIAGQSIRVSLAGTALADALAPSFAHLSGLRAEQAGASVSLWDTRETGIARPAVPDGADWALAGQGWRVSYHGRGRYLCEERPSGLLWLDRRDARLVGCVADARRLNCEDRARPLRRMMTEFCRSVGIQEIHAGMVARDGNGVLILGGSGRGKSTASLDGLHQGLDFLGDDSLGLGDDGAGGFFGHCLYASARVLPRQHARWPRFHGHWRFDGSAEEKALLLPGISFPDQVVPTARVVAIALPTVSGRGLRVTRTSPLAAFNALMNESRESRRFGLRPAEFARLAGVTRSVPCYRFEVDAAAERVADGLRRLLEDAPALQPHGA